MAGAKDRRKKLRGKQKRDRAKAGKLRSTLAKIKAAIAKRAKRIKDLSKRIRKRHHKPSGQLAMFDSIDVGQIPTDAKAVAGYVNGNWPTYNVLKGHFPHAHVLSIAVTASADAHCLDVEPGDATSDEAAGWVKRQHSHGVARPVVYTSLGNAQALLAALGRAGIERKHIKLWTAHYTGKAHLCTSACGYGFTGKADATQWTDHALGRNLDESLCGRGFFS